MIDVDYNRSIADTACMARLVAQAILDKRPLSVISMCDGESATLWAGKGFARFHYLAGYGIPAEEFVPAAEQLAAAIARADVIGVPRSGTAARTPEYGPKLRESLALWNIELKPSAVIADSLYTFYLMFDMWLWGLTHDRRVWLWGLTLFRRVLIINNEADKVANAFLTQTLPPTQKTYIGADWMRVSGADAIILQDGLAGSAKAIAEAAALPIKPDIALLGAGARAAHIAVKVAAIHSIPVVELGSICTLFWNDWGFDNAAQMHAQYLR
jgi:hypothetical protein